MLTIFIKWPSGASSSYDPPEADKCLLAFGEFNVRCWTFKKYFTLQLSSIFNSHRNGRTSPDPPPEVEASIRGGGLHQRWGPPPLVEGFVNTNPGMNIGLQAFNLEPTNP
jgi:hypothetical protein